MDLRSLRYFLAVAEQGGFTAAAERLHIAQPAVSMAIRKLEQTLDLQLFDRQERRVRLTDEGEVLARHARHILQAVNDAERELHELHGLSRGEVRVGIPSMLGSYYFPPILMAFRQRYPGIRLEVVEAGTRKLQQMIHQGDIDMGVIVTDTPPDDLETHSFLRDQMMAILPRDHPLAHADNVSYDAFFAEELVLFKEGYFHREVIDRISREAGVTPHIGFEANLIPLIKQIVSHGYGITTLLAMVVADDPTLVARPFSPPVWLDLSLAWRRGHRLSRANQTFVDLVLEQATHRRDG
ncbi:LysR family transcriptional regulator [Marinobacterium weihaiense]|uniref:LysR family transcriptional regulator n=1 Tax=Marinobacterium weihaiense TaxID=2851016 RepID=A0ABS6MDD5_9GAMM|nr:LysR substrate-binding domain-containing protein [Marinobacterium weihaiense]MBV0934304.1 LysR family transcriptional regulator [Marinobacterium weihaiense]